jgi:hypothetical protein
VRTTILELNGASKSRRPTCEKKNEISGFQQKAYLSLTSQDCIGDPKISEEVRIHLESLRVIDKLSESNTQDTVAINRSPEIRCNNVTLSN